MIQGDGFLIIEPADIGTARDHLERINKEANSRIEDDAPEIRGFRDSAKAVTVDIFILTAAAEIGERVVRQQGGLVILEEDAPENVRNAAAAALELLRQQGNRTHEATEDGPLS